MFGDTMILVAMGLIGNGSALKNATDCCMVFGGGELTKGETSGKSAREARRQTIVARCHSLMAHWLPSGVANGKRDREFCRTQKVDEAHTSSLALTASTSNISRARKRARLLSFT